MILPDNNIERHFSVNEIVKQNYRTADVFRKYGIEYCCGGNWPIEMVCLTKGLEFEALKKELQVAGHPIQLTRTLPFHDWPLDFLINFIVNIHHHYLKTTLPLTESILKDFASDHAEKFPYMQEVHRHFSALKDEILPHLRQEEETVFPYILQLNTAYKNKDSYAKLFIKTLRKPIENMPAHEHKFLNSFVQKFRSLTNNYLPPERACISHRIALAKLKELDNDLTQHVFLENEIVFPKALKIEEEILNL